jgi:hypothetical protein
MSQRVSHGTWIGSRAKAGDPTFRAEPPPRVASMIILYVLNLSLATVLIFWPLWFSRRILRLPWLNAVSILMLVGVPFELMKLFAGPYVLIADGLTDPGFQYAVLMANLLSFFQLLGTYVFFEFASWSRAERFLPFRYFVLTPKHLRRGSILFLGLFGIFFYLLASAYVGVAAWLSNPRMGYQFLRAGEGHWYALSVNALSVACMLSFLIKPTTRMIAFKTVFFFVLSYVLGAKGFMLAVFTAGLVLVSFVSGRQVVRVLIIGSVPVFILLVYNLALAMGDAFELQSVVEYFEYYRNAADYYNGILNGSIQLFHGQVMLTSFWAYVPRILVPDKPFAYGIGLVIDIFFPGAAELSNTPAFGGAVEQYADFGVWGVALFGFFSTQSFLNGFLYYFLFRKPGFSARRVTLGTFMALLALAGPFFGTFIPGLLYWVLVAVVMLLIGLVKPRTSGRRSAAPGGAELAAPMENS